MSWHYLRGQEAESWVANSLDGAPYALLRLLPTQGRPCSHDNETAYCPDSPSGTTPGPSTATHGADQSMSSPVGFHVKMSPRQVRVADLPVHVRDYGAKCAELLRRFGLFLSSPKTRLTCERVALAPSSRTLKLWGMTFDGECWALGTSAALIEDDGSGYVLPTPTANAYGTSNNGKRGDGTTFKQAGKASLFTMALSGIWPDGEHASGRLNPEFIEHLMGWPIGWTALEPLETGKSRSWLQRHGVSLGDQ